MFRLNNIRQGRKAIARDESGVAFIEFALSVGVLLIMFFGAIEISRYILIVQKVEKTIDTLTDVLAQQSGTILPTDITQYLNASQQLMNPYTFGANGMVILSDVYFPSGSTTPTVKWQVCGGGTLVSTSTVGVPGSAANLPGGFTMDAVENEEIVIGEIFYNYQPIILQSVVSPALVYRFAVFKPRITSITATSSGC